MIGQTRHYLPLLDEETELQGVKQFAEAHDQSLWSCSMTLRQADRDALLHRLTLPSDPHSPPPVFGKNVCLGPTGKLRSLPICLAGGTWSGGRPCRCPVPLLLLQMDIGPLVPSEPSCWPPDASAQGSPFSPSPRSHPTRVVSFLSSSPPSSSGHPAPRWDFSPSPAPQGFLASSQGMSPLQFRSAPQLRSHRTHCGVEGSFTLHEGAFWQHRCACAPVRDKEVASQHRGWAPWSPEMLQLRTQAQTTGHREETSAF